MGGKRQIPRHPDPIFPEEVARYSCLADGFTSPQDELIHFASIVIFISMLRPLAAICITTDPFTCSESFASTVTVPVLLLPFMSHSIFISCLVPVDVTMVCLQDRLLSSWNGL